MNYVESNALLKLKFRSFQQTLVQKVEVGGSIIDFLFQEDVIGPGNLKVLQEIEEYPGRQCKELLALLHDSEHPQAFIKLYLAIKKERHLNWVVDLIDRCSTGIVLKYTFQRTTTRGIDRKGLGSRDPLKICRRVRVCFNPLKCHILSFETVVG